VTTCLVSAALWGCAALAAQAAVPPAGRDARITVSGAPARQLFGKLYARSHLRADRWYKLGRELLYGQLEDEKPFKSVRRLVEQEDYALRVMRDAGLPSPGPYGFVELTPDREYLLVTEFFAGAVELSDAEVDDGVIDDGLGIIRKLWHAGLAHRDVKPGNLLVRDGWTVAEVAVNDGRSVVIFNHDQAGPSAVVLRLTAACDPTGAVQAPSPAPGVRRYQRAGPRTGEFRATWYDLFPGGCLTYQLHSTSDVKGSFTADLPALLGFATRDALRQALRQRSNGRLWLDPWPPVIR
jgi:hypothetical protein